MRLGRNKQCTDWYAVEKQECHTQEQTKIGLMVITIKEVFFAVHAYRLFVSFVAQNPLLGIFPKDLGNPNCQEI